MSSAEALLGFHCPPNENQMRSLSGSEVRRFSAFLTGVSSKATPNFSFQASLSW